MSKDPAFLFYPNDWLGGTMGMTFEQKGAYFELLIFQFNNHHFTEAQAKQVLSMCFSSAWDMVRQKFETEGENGEFYFNPRLRDEIEKRKKFTESRRINALHDKKPRNSEKAYAKHMGNENENENINKDNNKNINKKEKIKHLDSVLLSEQEFEKLVVKYGHDTTMKAIEILNNGIMSKGYKYKSHYHTIIGWPMREAMGGNNANTSQGFSTNSYRRNNQDRGGLKPENEAKLDAAINEYKTKKAALCATKEIPSTDHG